MLSNISSMAVLIEHSFFDSYAGDSRDGGGAAASFSAGDTISMSVTSIASADEIDGLSYAFLALFRSEFPRLDGVTSGVCLRCQTKPAVACFFVWRSLQSCYSWILSSDHRTSVLPFLERFQVDHKYDVFRVLFVSGDSVVNVGSISPHQILEQGGEGQVLRN